MTTHSYSYVAHARHPVDVIVTPALDDRNRLSIAFRPLLAIPHLILVGGPLAGMVVVDSQWRPETAAGWSAGSGLLGAVAIVAAIIAWVMILATGESPAGLRDLTTFYLQWRLRVLAYCSLLADEYPPFGNGPYPDVLVLPPVAGPRDRLSIAFRPILAIPQVIALWILSLAWAVATLAAWVALLVTGRHPRALFAFSSGILRWTLRVEAYLLLLTDEYPPFSLS